MIDTDKYEGHSVAPWKFGEDDEGVYLTSDGSTIWETSERGCPTCAKDNGWRPYYDCITHRLNDMDKTLIADAPLLLTEVKRLREELQKVCSHTDYSMTMTGAVCNICGLEEGDEQ
jgi:hypothetical protein